MADQYVPWDERELSEDEQLMWDELVKEEMAKMEGELQEAAMLAQASASGSNSNSEAPSRPTNLLPRNSSSHQFLPDTSLAGPGQRQGQNQGQAGTRQHAAAQDASVTILQARKTRPAPEAMPVPPSFLSAIGASTRAAQNTKLSKQQDFLNLVARDEEARLEARRRQEEGGAEWGHLETSSTGRRVSSESERHAHVERTTREPYTSRWDNVGTTQPVAHDAAARHLAQMEIKRSQQEAYRRDLAEQAELTRAMRQGVVTPTLGAPRDGANPVLLPPEHPDQFPGPTSTRRGRAGVGPLASEDAERKRQQQQAYHEQLASQLRAAEAQRAAEARQQGQVAYRDAYTVKNVRVRGDEDLGIWDQQVNRDGRRLPRRAQQSPRDDDAVDAGPSFLDSIGTHQSTQAHLKRQQQQTYRRELDAAASSSAPAAERVPLKTRISGIPGQSERNVELFGRGDGTWGGGVGADNSATSIAIGSTLLTAEVAERKRRGQHEYARQIAEAASARPLASPRVALRGGAAAVGGRHYSDPSGGESTAAAISNGGGGGAGASGVLVSGFSGLGPQTSLALRRAQQQDYKMSLQRDQQREMERVSREGGDESGRQPLRPHRPEAPGSTGLMVGPNLGTATRQALLLQKREDYSRELQQDAQQQEIPRTYHRQPRPVSPASPRQQQGQEDFGYWNIGTSLQVGAPTAINKERERGLREEYQRGLREDAQSQSIASPRRPSPRRPSQRDDEAPSAHHNSLHLQQMEIRTAEALMAQRRQQERYLQQLQEGASEEPVPHSRVPMLAIRQQNERPESFLLPGDHRAQAAYGQEPSLQQQHLYQQLQRQQQQQQQHQQQFGADSAGPRSRMMRAGSSEEYALHQQPY